jgi:hypothetical protein
MWSQPGPFGMKEIQMPPRDSGETRPDAAFWSSDGDSLA